MPCPRAISSKKSVFVSIIVCDGSVVPNSSTSPLVGQRRHRTVASLLGCVLNIQNGARAIGICRIHGVLNRSMFCSWRKRIGGEGELWEADSGVVAAGFELAFLQRLQCGFDIRVVSHKIESWMCAHPLFPFRRLTIPRGKCCKGPL